MMRAGLGLLQDEFQLSGEFQAFQGWAERAEGTGLAVQLFSPRGTFLRAQPFVRSERGEFVVRKIVEQWSFIRQARALAGSVDLFHVFLPTPNFLWVAARIERDCGKPVVATCLSEQADRLPSEFDLFHFSTARFHLMRWIAARLLPRGPFTCRRYVVGSRALQSQLRAQGCPEERITRLPLVLPSEAPPDARTLALVDRLKEKPTFVYMGHFLPNKGVDIFLEALSRLSSPDARGLLAWSGLGDLQGVQRKIKDLGISDRIILTDYPLHRSTVFAQAAAIVLPLLASYGQVSPPLVLLEAFRTGVPLVVSRLAAFDEFVRDSETAFYAVPGDADDVARQMQKVLQEKARMDIMREAQRALFAGWSREIDIPSLYASCVAVPHG